MGMNTDLAGTPYQQKFAAYLTSGESETFTYTVRRSGSCYYIGVDGIEYCCVELGGARKPSSATENLTGTISENLTGTRVGLRSKSTNVYYNNITITPAEEVSVTFDAVNGRMDGEQIVVKTYSYNDAIGTLPTPVYEGFEFAGWYYTDYLTGETKQLTAETVLDDSFWQLTVTARWRREGAQPYTVSFDTGVDGYTVADVEGWYEGNPLAAPELSRTFWTFSEEWYYDEECTRPVDLNAVDPTQTGAGGTQAFTLYAKAEEHDFTGEGWTETDGTYTGSTDTLVNGFEAKAGQTLEIDITLPAYSSSYGVSGILFGATGLGANDSYYWLRIVCWPLSAALPWAMRRARVRVRKRRGRSTAPTFRSGCSICCSAANFNGMIGKGVLFGRLFLLQAGGAIDSAGSGCYNDEKHRKAEKR